MKPSEQIKQQIPAIAARLLERTKTAKRSQGGLAIYGPAENARMLAEISDSPMTWVVAILAYLDEQAEKAERPSTRLKPNLSKDGNKWCALYGADIVTGMAGFGDTPEEALKDFDAEWMEQRA